VELELPDGDGAAFAAELNRLPSPPRVGLMTRATEAVRDSRRPGVEGRLVKPIKQSQLFNWLVEVRCEPLAPSGAGLVAGDRSGANLRVLVVEDHDINRRLAMLMLEKLGCRAEFASDGEAAVAAWQRFPYDVILMDCQMPVMDGYEATQRIRQLERPAVPAGRRRTHIIALTANAMAGDREKCLAAGMDGYLSKPLRIEALQSSLSRLQQGATVEASGPPADLPQIEASVGELIQEFGAEAAVELLTTFLGETPDRLAAVRRQADGTHDRAGFARAAHSMAGSCGIFGLESMRKTALSLEDAVNHGSADVLPLVLQLKHHFQVARPALERLLASAGAGSTP